MSRLVGEKSPHSTLRASSNLMTRVFDVSATHQHFFFLLLFRTSPTPSTASPFLNRAEHTSHARAHPTPHPTSHYPTQRITRTPQRVNDNTAMEGGNELSYAPIIDLPDGVYNHGGRDKQDRSFGFLFGVCTVTALGLGIFACTNVNANYEKLADPSLMKVRACVRACVCVHARACAPVALSAGQNGAAGASPPPPFFIFFIFYVPPFPKGFF